MSWLYSQALVEEYSAAKFSDGEPSVPSRSTNTPEMFSSHGKTMECSRLSRFGMTCELLTDDLGGELLMSFREDFRARTSALPEKVAELTERDRAYGAKWRASSVRYDRNTSSWRTHRCLFDGDLIESLQTLPKWGSMRSGELWELTTPVLRTDGNASGYWPTPTATAYKGWSPNHNRADSDDRIDYTVEREAHKNGKSGRLNPEWVEWLMFWPIGHTDLKPIKRRHLEFYKKIQLFWESTWTQKSQALVHGGNLRKMWSDSGFDETPQGQEPIKQRTIEYFNSVQKLSRKTTRYGQMGMLEQDENMQMVRERICLQEKEGDHMQSELWEQACLEQEKDWWESDPSEFGIGRVVENMAYRSHRVRALGNGQVPRVVALAWKILTKELEQC